VPRERLLLAGAAINAVRIRNASAREFNAPADPTRAG